MPAKCLLFDSSRKKIDQYFVKSAGDLVNHLGDEIEFDRNIVTLEALATESDAQAPQVRSTLCSDLAIHS